MDPKNIKMRVVYSSNKPKMATFATAVGEAFKCQVDAVPPAFPCDKERIVVLLMNASKDPDDALKRFCRELNGQRAYNVCIVADGDKDSVPVKKVKEALREAGTNVIEDVYSVNGGSAGLLGMFNKKISLDERRDIVKWVTSTIEAL
ncbi:MAG: hypothetical protein E7578_00700 [Ruminococcaceae bacterium]|nr:hypothetical protein [Oscillospiraceae bacterium]